MKKPNQLEDFDLRQLDRARVEVVLQQVWPTRLDEHRLRELKKRTGLTGAQLDKALNLLAEAELAIIQAKYGSLHVSLTEAGEQMRKAM